MPTTSISCPACGYTKEIPSAKLPIKPASVNCPSCKIQFLVTPSGKSEAKPIKSAKPNQLNSRKAPTTAPLRTTAQKSEQSTFSSKFANKGLIAILFFVVILLGLAGGRIWLDDKARSVPFPYWLAASEQGVAVLYGQEFYVVNFNGDILWSQKLPEGVIPCQISWHGDQIWVSDWENDSLLQFKSDQTVTIHLTGPEIAAHLNVAVDKSSGNFFIADSQGSRISTYSSDGNFIRSFGQAGRMDGQLLSPKDIAFDDEGRLIVGNTLRPAVDVFQTDGTFLRTLTKPKGKPGYIFLTDFAINQNNLVTIECDLMVTDCVVAAYTQEGSLLSTRKQTPNEAAGDVAIWDGIVYISDCLNRRVGAYDAQSLEPFGPLSTELDRIGENYIKEYSFYKFISNLSLIPMILCFIVILTLYIRSKKH